MRETFHAAIWIYETQMYFQDEMVHGFLETCRPDDMK